MKRSWPATRVNPAVALHVLSVILGAFLLLMGLDKLGWLADSGLLVDRLRKWTATAPAVSRWYLEHVAIPGAPLFARLVVLGEAAAGVALIVGVRVRLAAWLALAMILQFHVAAGVLFDFAYLTNGYGPPVLGGLLALALGGADRPFRPGTTRTVEIRAYNLKPGAREAFDRLARERAVPMLRRWNVDVVAFGPSPYDETSYFLIRSYADPAERQRSQDAFYGSDEWRSGPRDEILAPIESYTSTVLQLDEATVNELR